MTRDDTGGRPRPVVIDTMGGDHAPEEIVAGAVAAVREHGVRLVLVGQAPRVRAELERHGVTGEIPIVHAEEALAMDEGALASWRKPRSSVAVACHLIKTGRASALVSAGTTAGVVATARLRLKAQQGVLRPAIAVLLPTRPRPTVLLDSGASVDVKPEVLVQFAALGTAYAQVALGVPRPRVGLLNIGSEPGKGNKAVRRAYELLSSGHHGIEFAGNIEGGDLLTGAVDVVVCDGFTGNVALKTMEGAVRMAMAELQQTIRSSATAKLGALLQRRRLQALKARLDSETYGGGVLLGLNGTVVIAHGASQARAITSACLLAQDLAAGRIVERIRDQIAATRTSRFGWRHGDKSDRETKPEQEPPVPPEQEAGRDLPPPP
ncbi:phosphate acyltransferase PlsX [Thermomonospora curvata]|uniref:Phosphate acyltransferase n=1 Tax=Thermomonospora curvata (strain ATCC 19995 / DSM 43183 / JCM 3096 / KCTC 9072 / NBRC 15933 / NCIMB 10081 / Henssen B9) TaxID=471852 RepID=D1A6G9_THECD|nr:phosphate acyltransferase PlsX [Thermomonospora curvata]ACY96444.1 fatty acid/phospholipid synthesis protein PlsX [Thermomonospora curvata DSM 43183]